MHEHVFPRASVWCSSCAYTCELEHTILNKISNLLYVSETLFYRIKLLLLQLRFLLAQ